MQEGRRPSAGQILVAMQFTFAGKGSVRPPVQPISGFEVVRFADQIREDPRGFREPVKLYPPSTEKAEGTATPGNQYAREMRRRRARVPGLCVAYSACGCHMENS